MKVLGSTFVVASVLTLAVAAGCSEKPAEKAGSAAGKAGGQSHAGHGTGPHDGTVADWGGGKYHVEFTVDHGKKETVVYVLGGDEKSPAAIQPSGGKLLLSITKPAFQVDLQPQPQPGEPAGKSSRFVGKHDNLGIVQEFAGSISAEVDGTPYVGEFKEEPHGADGHH